MKPILSLITFFSVLSILSIAVMVERAVVHADRLPWAPSPMAGVERRRGDAQIVRVELKRSRHAVVRGSVIGGESRSTDGPCGLAPRRTM
jgi:hypothetical protein